MTTTEYLWERLRAVLRDWDWKVRRVCRRLEKRALNRFEGSITSYLTRRKINEQMLLAGWYCGGSPSCPREHVPISGFAEFRPLPPKVNGAYVITL